MVNKGPGTYWKGIALLFLVSIGIVSRIVYLGTVPGLEHDESLILLGAKRIVSLGTYPLTGDKIYEGPLAEVLVSLFFRVLGEGVWQGRFVIALFSIILFILTYLIGEELFPYSYSGLIATSLLVFSPWHLFSSRVLYACNLVPFCFTCSMYCFIIFLKRGWLPGLILSGFCLGLAMHGHLYALLGIFIVVPMMVFHFRGGDRGKPVTYSVIYILVILLTTSPLWIYQVREGFPIVRHISYHVSTGKQAFCITYAGYTWRFFETLGGKDFWVDYTTGTSIFLILPIGISFITSIFFVIFGNSGSNGKSVVLLLCWLILPFIFVPGVLPAHFVEGVQGPRLPPPHYFDVVFPAPYLLLGFFLSSLVVMERGSIRILGGIVLVLILITNAMIQYKEFFLVFEEQGGRGRWRQDLQGIAKYLQSRSPGPKEVIFGGSYFGGGYPQLKFLLGNRRVLPYLRKTPPGVYGKPFSRKKQYLEPSMIYLVVKGRIPEEFLPFQAEPIIPLPGTGWLIYRYGSPGARISLSFNNGDTFSYEGIQGFSSTLQGKVEFSWATRLQVFHGSLENRRDTIGKVTEFPSYIAISERYQSFFTNPSQENVNWDYFYDILEVELSGKLNNWDNPGTWVLKVSRLKKKARLTINPGYKNECNLDGSETIFW